MRAPHIYPWQTLPIKVSSLHLCQCAASVDEVALQNDVTSHDGTYKVGLFTLCVEFLFFILIRQGCLTISFNSHLARKVLQVFSVSCAIYDLVNSLDKVMIMRKASLNNRFQLNFFQPTQPNYTN